MTISPHKHYIIICHSSHYNVFHDHYASPLRRPPFLREDGFSSEPLQQLAQCLALPNMVNGPLIVFLSEYLELLGN